MVLPVVEEVEAVVREFGSKGKLAKWKTSRWPRPSSGEEREGRWRDINVGEDPMRGGWEGVGDDSGCRHGRAQYRGHHSQVGLTPFQIP
jgi:hypothetical protein